MMQGLLDALKRVADLDAPLGLRNTAGNLPLYANLLNNFLTGQAPAVARIRRSLEQGDLVGAERTAHTLKGVAATLGASRLSASAGVLEHLLAAPASAAKLNPAIAATGRCLDAVLAGLRPLADRLTREIEAAQSHYVPNPTLLHTIGDLLAEDDAHAVELWGAHAAVLKALVPNGEQVDSAIRSFDFEHALQLLRAA